MITHISKPGPQPNGQKSTLFVIQWPFFSRSWARFLIILLLVTRQHKHMVGRQRVMDHAIEVHTLVTNSGWNPFSPWLGRPHQGPARSWPGLRVCSAHLHRHPSDGERERERGLFLQCLLQSGRGSHDILDPPASAVTFQVSSGQVSNTLYYPGGTHAGYSWVVTAPPAGESRQTAQWIRGHWWA